jgi:acetyl-CoA carboxylase carboxyltransferase component
VGAAVGRGAADRRRGRPLLRGNAVIAGCSDLIVATENVSIGMGGPAMIEGGGLGRVEPDDVGPLDMQTRNGVIDVVVADEREATAVTKKLLGYFQGPAAPGAVPDQERLRDLVPERQRRAYRVEPIIETLADEGSATVPARALRARDGHRARAHRGPPAGVIANNTMHMAGAITSDAPTRRRASCSCATRSACRSSRSSTRPG